jgi:hypothetical protein
MVDCEVDYTTKATGATIVVDGGIVPRVTAGRCPRTKRKPQPQFCTQADVDAGYECTTVGRQSINPNRQQSFQDRNRTFRFCSRNDCPCRTEQQNRLVRRTMCRAKTGIAGIAFTQQGQRTTRYAVGETWEPGIESIRRYLIMETATSMT